MSKPKKIKWTGAMPPCDICKLVERNPEPRPGEFDVPTTAGPWASVCKEHLNEYGHNIEIGFHRVPKDAGEGV